MSPQLTAALRLQYCTPTERNSITQRDPFTPSVFLRPAKIGQTTAAHTDIGQKPDIASPEFLQNVLYRQLSGFMQQQSMTSDNAQLKQLIA
jgi:hypothetical protein